MDVTRSKSFGVRGLVAVLGVAAASYAAYVAGTWYRYGHPSPPKPDEADELLDGFMYRYEVVERQHVRVNAPADITFAALMRMDLQNLAIVRAIFKAREFTLGSQPDSAQPTGSLVDVTKALGWRLLGEVPGREVVMGAVTRPWTPNPVFRGLPPEEFVAFAEPGYVKIVWTLRADPVDGMRSIARTETRVVATDAMARSAFRRYWACVSPGIWLIRKASLRWVKREAERRTALHASSGSSTVIVAPPVGGRSI